MAEEFRYADVDYDGKGVARSARSAQSSGVLRPMGGPVMELADGSRIVFLPERGSRLSTTWYPLDQRNDADYGRPLGPWGTPGAELLERLKQYSE